MPAWSAAPTRYDLVGVHRHVRFLATGQAPHERLDHGHARRAPDQDHLVDVVRRQLRVGESLLDRTAAALEQIDRQLLELRAREAGIQMLRSGGVGRDERQADLRLRGRRKVDLGALRRLEQPLQSLRVGAQVDAVIALELVGQPVDDALVEVVAPEVTVAARRAHLDHAVADVESETSNVPPPRSKTRTVS